MPLLVHLPALSGWYRFDPIYLVSGLTEGAWQSNGLLPGYPWTDANAGVTTQALGALAARNWLHLQIPWWNPYSGIGLPLVAEGQTPAFFLPFVLILAVPHGLLALRMVLMALAGLFTFALLRRLRLDLLPALTGALLFELNGTFALAAHGPIMPVAFLPLVLLGLEHARSSTFPLATVLGVAWSFLAGFPETAVLNMLLAAAWGTWRLAQAPSRAAYAWRAGGAAVAGLLLAAPAIWPFLEALPREFLGHHADADASGLLPPNLGLLLFPGVFGNPHAPPHAAAMGQTWARAGGYVCLAQVALACAALRRRAPEAGLRWVLAAFVVLTAARAALVPVAVMAFGWLPLLRQAMVHIYILPAWSLVIAVLGALALQDWRQGRRAGLPIALVVVALGLAAIASVAPLLTLESRWLISAGAAIVVGTLAATAAVWLLRDAASRGRRRLLSGLLVVQAALLFVLPGLSGTHGRQLDVGAIQFLQAHAGLGRVVSFGPLVPNYGAMFGIAQLNHNALPVPAIWEHAVRTRFQPQGDGINFAEGALPDPARLRQLLPAYEAAGATFAVTWPSDDLAHAMPGPVEVYPGTTMRIWSLPASAPYAEAPGCDLSAQDRLAFTAECRAPSHLLRRELFWPGWRASVNGAPTPVRPQDIYEVIDLPPGPSTVRFWYTPPHAALAWCACLAGALLAAAGYRLAPRPGLAEERRRAAHQART
jgi:hypothetical protein